MVVVASVGSVVGRADDQELHVTAIRRGDEAPDFELRDSTGQPVRLSDYRGKKAVVLMFYPFAFTGICTGELCTIRDRLTDFSNDEVETLAISTDPSPALREFAAREGLEFPLLSDFWPHGEAARAYGVFNEQVGVAERGTFVIDKEGVVVWSVHNGIGEERDDSDYFDALQEIGAA